MVFVNPTENELLPVSTSEFELSLAEFSFDTRQILGIGNFGTVYKGIAKGYPAAIKKPNENCPVSTFSNILCEIKVLQMIGKHPNVVGFIGAYIKDVQKRILYVATELCSSGSLLNFLRRQETAYNRNDIQNQTVYQENFLDFYDLHKFSMETANGMEYITGKHLIHGDLSARNILLDQNLTCKISDFGFSRKVYECQKYVKKSQEPLPWKWMAYESLKHMEFTTKSDMWSYGVTLWEIYSLGDVPYGGLNWTPGFSGVLQEGLRLSKPEFATDEIYSSMLDCWNLNADLRPKFLEMAQFFHKLCENKYVILDER